MSKKIPQKLKVIIAAISILAVFALAGMAFLNFDNIVNGGHNNSTVDNRNSVRTCNRAKTTKRRSKTMSTTRDGKRSTGVKAVAVLMYHLVNDNATFKNATEKSLTMPVAAFKQQLDWMAANGYHVISMEDAYAGLVYGKPLPSKPVVLTFDDGAPDAYTNVYPILSQRGLSGTFFIIAGRVDAGEGLNWSKVNEMADAGMVIGSHTMTHANLSTKTPEQADYELQESKSLIEQNINRPVHFFCYPFGSITAQVVQEVKQAGYEAAFTTRPGYWKIGANIYTLNRVRVSRGESIRAFAGSLSGIGATNKTQTKAGKSSIRSRLGKTKHTIKSK